MLSSNISKTSSKVIENLPRTKKMEEPNSKSKIEPVDLDTIFSRDIGKISPLQLRTVAVCTLATILFVMVASEFVFTTGRIKSRCLIPECEGSNPMEFEPSWLANAVPFTGDSFESCQRFANTSAEFTYVDDASCPATHFDRQTIVSCEQQVYEDTSTVVYDLDLGCSEWLRSLLGSVRTTGAFIAMPLAGAISDRWGRRTALIVITFNTAVIGLSRYFVNTYIGYIISLFAEESFGSGGLHACLYIFGVEMVPTKYRLIAGAFLSSGSTCGQIILGLLAWNLPNWRNLILIIYSLQFLVLFLLWISPESVRWSISKGRFSEAEIILAKLAKSCGKQLTSQTLLELKSGKQVKKEQQENKPNKNGPWLIVLVLRNKPILLRCLVVPVWWITLTLVYLGLTLNVVNIAGNKYVSYIVLAAMNIPGLLSAYILNTYIGRKIAVILSFWMCSLCQLAFIFMPEDMYALSLTVYLIGKFCICLVGATIHIYTSELFPTQYRNQLFGYCTSIGHFGSMLAPLTPALGAMVWDNLPYVLFGAMAFLSGLLAFLMPETSGCRLPDTMEDAVNIGRQPQHTNTSETS